MCSSSWVAAKVEDLRAYIARGALDRLAHHDDAELALVPWSQNGVASVSIGA
jgi:hypothetical protein